MSLNDKFIYGLATNRLLNDVQDKEQAITNLGLVKSDFTAIQGANQAGVSNKDLMTVSGLARNIYPVLDRYSFNLAVANNSFQEVVGSDSPVIRGNLTLNGQLAASGITYNKLDLAAPSNYQPLSVSTAVNSAWSFFDPQFTAATDLYYGNQVTVTDNSLSVNYLGSQSEPVSQVFSAEIPTHMVQIQVGAHTYGVFAQAGAPLELVGNFQNFRGRIVRNTSWPGLYVSWRIQQAGVTQAQAEDVLATATNVVFNSNKPESRSFQIYYPTSGISEISAPNMGLRSWPSIILDQLVTLDVSRNQLLDVPNFKVLTPALKTCIIQGNRFYLGAKTEWRRLGTSVGALLPASLETLVAFDAFVGSLVDGVPVAGTTLSVLNSLPNLRVFRVGSNFTSSTSTIGPDSVDTVGYFPDVALSGEGVSTIVEYSVQDTALRDLSRLTNLRNSPELTTLNLISNNFASSSNFSVNSSKIRTVNVSATRINIMDMRNKQELQTYSATQVSQLPEAHSLYVSSNPTDSDYKFINCIKLTTLDLSNSTYTGFFPKLIGNTSLINFLASNTQMSGGRPGVIQTAVSQQVTNSSIINVVNASGILPNMWVSGVGIPANTQVVSVDNNEVTLSRNIANLAANITLSFGNHVLAEDTFADCPNLRVFNFSSSFMFSFQLHPNVFNTSRNLEFLRLQSNGRLGGALPVFSNCVNLTSLDLSNNAFLGAVPAFITNTRLTSVQMSNNLLAGTLPAWSLPNISVLNLTNNRISSFALNGTTTTLGSMRRLRQLRLSFNQINNPLPMLSDQTPLLERLEIQNNQISTYVKGTLATCNRLTFINLSNNLLNQTAVNDIILDVDQSVQLVRRAGTLSLTGAQMASPSANLTIISALNRLSAAGWRVQTNPL